MPNNTSFSAFNKILCGFYPKILIWPAQFLNAAVIHNKIMQQFNKPFFVEQLHDIFIQRKIVFGGSASGGFGELQQVSIVLFYFFFFLLPFSKKFFFFV